MEAEGEKRKRGRCTRCDEAPVLMPNGARLPRVIAVALAVVASVIIAVVRGGGGGVVAKKKSKKQTEALLRF